MIWTLSESHYQNFFIGSRTTFLSMEGLRKRSDWSAWGCYFFGAMQTLEIGHMHSKFGKRLQTTFGTWNIQTPATTAFVKRGTKRANFGAMARPFPDIGPHIGFDQKASQRWGKLNPVVRTGVGPRSQKLKKTARPMYADAVCCLNRPIHEMNGR